MPSAGAARTPAKEGRYGETCHYGPSFEQFQCFERLSRPRAEAIECELRWLSRYDVYVQVAVVLFGVFAVPVQILGVALGKLVVCPAGKDGILFRAASAQ